MEVPSLTLTGTWETIFGKRNRSALEDILPDFLYSQRWFGGKARRILSTAIEDAVPVRHAGGTTYLTFVNVDYGDGGLETYSLPFTLVSGQESARIETVGSQTVVARLVAADESGILSATLRNVELCKAFLDAIGESRSFESEGSGQVRGVPTRVYRRLVGQDPSLLTPSLMRGEQSNSSIRYGDRLILKIFRRLEHGLNPDLEVGGFLTEAGFRHVPAVGGSLEYRKGKDDPVTVAILQAFVPCQGDAWQYTLNELVGYYERVEKQKSAGLPSDPEAKGVRNLTRRTPDTEMSALIGPYLDAVGLLGRRTAELHLALASDTRTQAFAPVPFSADYRRSLCRSMESMAAAAFQLLRQRMPTLPEFVRGEAHQVLSLEPQLTGRFRALFGGEVNGLRTRVHGDYHLGQVLYTGSDFVIIDFEGEPAHSISERRIKRSPLRDVAGMLRSFDYAAASGLRARAEANGVSAEARRDLEGWAVRWCAKVSAAYLEDYIQVAGGAPFLPPSREELLLLLDAYRLEKAIYEISYELNNRPEWVGIPLRGILQLSRRPE